MTLMTGKYLKEVLELVNWMSEMGYHHRYDKEDESLTFQLEV